MTRTQAQQVPQHSPRGISTSRPPVPMTAQTVQSPPMVQSATMNSDMTEAINAHCPNCPGC